MLGKLLSSAVKIATLPVDIVDATLDVASGGDGSKESRKTGGNPITEVRDGIGKAIEDIDE